MAAKRIKVWGPAPVQTLVHRQYYVSFTDDFSRLTHLYLLRRKSDTFAAYKEYKAWCHTQMMAPIRALRSDRGGEYLSNKFRAHLKAAGTEHRLTVHDTPAQNGVVERLNRTLIEHVRAMLHASGLPMSLWGEAVRHAVWLKNRTSTKALKGKTPLEAARTCRPNLSMIREWGCKVWVHDDRGSKLQPCAR